VISNFETDEWVQNYKGLQKIYMHQAIIKKKAFSTAFKNTAKITSKKCKRHDDAIAISRVNASIYRQNLRLHSQFHSI